MMTFSPCNEQEPSFHVELGRLSALVCDMEAIGRGVVPEDLAGDRAPLLDHWTVGGRMVPFLVGLSTGHPLLPGENRMIGTSDLWLMSDDRCWARTRSRWYRLGREVDQAVLQS